MVRIIVYDDSKVRRDSLHALLSFLPDHEFVAGFDNCNTVIADIEKWMPDLVLMDIEMPGVDGITGVGLIKQKFPQVKIIIQTVFDDDEKVFAALQAGAEGYLLKNASIQQITQSIDDVMLGGAGMSPSIALKVMKYFSKQPLPDSKNLSPKETEVLRLLTRGLSYKMVADAMGISYFTVNNHVRSIYEKLQVHSLAGALAIMNKSSK